jgi:hypothetical protein
MKQLTCHRCGSPDLVLHETYLEHSEFDGGLFINDQGRIEARGEAVHTPGDIQPRLTRIECLACRHEWRPRREFSGISIG